MCALQYGAVTLPAVETFNVGVTTASLPKEAISYYEASEVSVVFSVIVIIMIIIIMIIIPTFKSPPRRRIWHSEASDTYTHSEASEVWYEASSVSVVFSVYIWRKLCMLVS